MYLVWRFREWQPRNLVAKGISGRYFVCARDMTPTELAEYESAMRLHYTVYSPMRDCMQTFIADEIACGVDEEFVYAFIESAHLTPRGA